MIEWIISSSVLIAVIIALRYLLRGKVSLRLQYALWGLVLLRLLIPFSIGSSSFSVMNVLPEDVPGAVLSPAAPDSAYTGPEDTNPAQSVPAVPNVTSSAAVQGEPEISYSDGVTDVLYKATDWGGIAKTVWLTGIAVMGLGLLLSNLHLAGKLKRSRRALAIEGYRLPVYLSDAVDTPCLFGVFRPSIYVTPEAAESETKLRHVLAHEMTHFRHGDNLWALLRGVCLALHWYNPLVWWAAVLSRNDAELACDEATIKRIGESERAEYGRTLIAITCQKRPALLSTATTMTGGKHGIRERITLIVKKPKMAVYTLIAVVLIAAVAVGCTFTGAKGGEDTADADAPVIEGDLEPDANPVADLENDKPTIPENVPNGIEYLYDFRFSERYDNQISPDFSLSSLGSAVVPDGTLSLFEKYQKASEPEEEYAYDSDGLVPHAYKRYRYVSPQGALVIGTDNYEPDNVEYLSYLWTDLAGAKTNRNISVGSSEADLLQAYTSNLYFLKKEEAEPNLVALNEERDFGFSFDHAYAWQPFTQETNEIRDITFYMEDGIVTAIEMIHPYELRYVYGYDRAAGLEYANAKRAAKGNSDVYKEAERVIGSYMSDIMGQDPTQASYGMYSIDGMEQMGNDIFAVVQYHRSMGEGSLHLFVLEEKAGVLTIIDRVDGRLPMSMGVELYQSTFSSKTVIFGAVNDQLWFDPGEMPVQVDFTQVKALYLNGAERSVNVSNFQAFVMCMDSDVYIDDVLFLSGSEIAGRLSELPFGENVMDRFNTSGSLY